MIILIKILLSQIQISIPTSKGKEKREKALKLIIILQFF